MIRAIAFACAVCVFASRPQQSSLVGTWHISYRAGLRLENGVATPILATGTLTVGAKGDSLIAELVNDSASGSRPRAPARLAAPASAGEATFTSRSTATLNINGAERAATAVSTWRLRARGDTLTGTVERRLEGVQVPPQPPGRVTGTRRKS